MNLFIFILCYLWTVTHHFAYAVAGFVFLGVFAVWALKAMPADPGAPFVPLMLLQMFAASSGFRQAADEGRFDVLLTSGPSRVRVVIGHALLSVGPGVVCWLTIGLLERLWQGDGAIGLRGGPLVGLLLVSGLAWAVAAPTGRLAGGLVWLLTLAAVVASPRGFAWFEQVFTPSSSSGLGATATEVAVFLVCPFLFLVPQAANAAADPWLLIGVSMFAVSGAVGTAWWMIGRDYRGRT